VLSHNAISEIKNIDHLSSLRKLCLAHNKIKVLPSYVLSFHPSLYSVYKIHIALVSLSCFPIATKRSHNRDQYIVTVIVAHRSFRLAAQFELAELRLNDNKLLRVPDSISLNPKLRILDLGRNLISDYRQEDALQRFLSFA
jgi:Leucine-rich repeat (LRR) protein